MKTVAFSVPDDKDLTDLLEVIAKFGFKLKIKLSVVKEPSVRLKKAIKEVENAQTIKCLNVDEMMKKLNE